VISTKQKGQSPRNRSNRKRVSGRKKKLNEINSHLISVLGELLDNLELGLAVACALVGREGITRHALVDLAGTIVASYISNARDRRAISASRRALVKRDVAASTYEYA